MRSDRYQIALILLGITATGTMGVFFYRELFPEYRIYQNDYVDLEKFRSSYTGEPPPAFKEGIKQIVIEREDKGPPVIDRCTSCHVALQFPHFSATRVARDINGNILYDADGQPVKESNPDYVWGRLDQKVADLQDKKINDQLIANGEGGKVNKRLAEADYLLSLKTAEVDGHIYDVTKVLSMHPLMGSETFPFEFHSADQYGCTSCHNGNGRGLTTEKAHGPVFDGQYEKEFVGYVPQFIEKDPQNDPEFSKVFNHKPGHELLFQTSPIYVGALIQAKCMQCHVTTASALDNAAFSTAALIQDHQKRSETVQAALDAEKNALLDTLQLTNSIKKQGLAKSLEVLQKQSQNYTLPPAITEAASTRLLNIQKAIKGLPADQSELAAVNLLDRYAGEALGSQELVKEARDAVSQGKDPSLALDAFIEKNVGNKEAVGTIFAKLRAIDLAKAVAHHIADVETSFSKAAGDEKTISAIASDIDLLTYNYRRGQELFISQACYACHRIAGFSRGGIGPELTQEGKSYPWFVKESIVWPQADLKTSTMPNMRLDHEELEDLVTFVLGQMGESKAISSSAYKTAIHQWEAGRKMAWEKPVTPAEIMDLRYSMTVFATQGCAACHRLKGYESNVGYAVEKKDKPDFNTLYAEREWFQKLFPEEIIGSEIVKRIEANSDQIDQRIAANVRAGSILEEIEENHPQAIESLYTPFKYAMRAKNTAYKDDPKKLKEWKERVHHVLMMFVQEYGLGRLIGPRPNWSGVYRTDEWLMEHFRNPASHVPRSIMPVLPFDDTKFFALTHMLDVLGIRNRNDVHSIWDHRGFNPEQAYQIHCSQCHGDYKLGNGPVAEWIYPIPKNLGDGTFLRNLTKENAILSITHGVKGTPMPPWGEAPQKPTSDGIPVLNPEEIKKLVDWLYSFLPGETGGQHGAQVPKWKYEPQDVIKELHKEGGKLVPLQSRNETTLPPELAALPRGREYLASLKPMPVNSEAGIDEYFDVVSNPNPGGEQKLYYIKKKYYTHENIEQGRAFFEMNCAPCHGKEADGAGLRAEAMREAKPRMLTNLDWIDSHDDLRLLRSIKYGVPGTAMTPWGDLTTSLQRMQLVIFIRSLSKIPELRSKLSSAIYQAFDRSDFQIEQARSTYYPQLADLEAKLSLVQEKRKNLYAQAKEGETQPKEAVDAYQQELSLLGRISRLKESDNLFKEMKANLKKEHDLYDNMGKSLIQNDPEGDLLEQYLTAVALLNGSYIFRENALSYQFSTEQRQKLLAAEGKIEAKIQSKIDQLQEERKITEGKIRTMERTHDLHELNADIHNLTKVKNMLMTGFAESLRLRDQQAQVYEKLQKDSLHKDIKLQK